MHTSDIRQLICKRTTSYLENCRRSYPYNEGTLLAAVRPPARHFHHFNNRIFPLENPVKNHPVTLLFQILLCWFWSFRKLLSLGFTARTPLACSKALSWTICISIPLSLGRQLMADMIPKFY